MQGVKGYEVRINRVKVCVYIYIGVESDNDTKQQLYAAIGEIQHATISKCKEGTEPVFAHATLQTTM